ncbi:multidrug resistance-associated protein [Colletotrichum truncatum]|uniref:Multidrug resistance-associated protein n=1 Tax=Colletotrichum truncatum TaxID=5467 RepID=A0ACC3ZLS1_COLTU|nr:multidrug resistance-associated protein [Colletotrichum truncatum]KAF6786985.1 multidrug resistance-associated protein [Colletotrichum truncatum]
MNATVQGLLSRFLCLLSLLLFSWAPPQPLTTVRSDVDDEEDKTGSEDGGIISASQKAEFLSQKLSQCWDRPSAWQANTSLPGRRLAFSILMCLRRDLIIGGLTELAAMLTAAAPPIILRWLLASLSDPITDGADAMFLGERITTDDPRQRGTPVTHTYLLVAAMALTQMGAGILINTSRYLLEGVGTQAKVALTGIIMEKAFVRPPSSTFLKTTKDSRKAKYNGNEKNWSNGAIFNLASVEASRIDGAINGINALWTVPASFILAIPMLVTNVDITALAGVIILLAGLPVFSHVALRIWTDQKALSEFCRRRSSCTQHLIQGIRGIKLAGWSAQTMVQNKLCQMRIWELVTANKVWQNRAVLEAGCALLPTLASMASLAAYNAFHDGVLDPARVFSSLALFLALKPHVIRASQAAMQLQDLLVGCQAIEEWLESEEPEKETGSLTESAIIVTENTTLVWPDSPAQDAFQLAFETEIRVIRGELVAICGNPGSGKSSLLAAAAGQMCLETGIMQLGRGVTVALAAQSPWIRSGTIRSNIVFNQPFDLERYQHVVRACALQVDIDRLPGRDLTVVGTGGQGLSSGQAQRVSIARALYSDADVVLIDDCLRNLDPEVAKVVLDQAICNSLVAKTRLLVTNQVDVARRCDRVLWLEHGRVSWLDSLDKLEKHLPYSIPEQDLSSDVKNEQSAAEALCSKPRPTDPTPSPVLQSRRIQSSSREKRHVAYDLYLELVGGIRTISTTIGLSISWQVAAAGVVLWLSWWTSNQIELPGLAFLAVFITLGFGEAILALWERSLRRVVEAPMWFFQSCSLGSVMDRLSKDVDTTDRELVEATRNAILHLSRLLGGIALMLMMQAKLIAAIAPGLAAVIAMMLRYAPRLKSVKTREANLRARANAALSEGIDGASCIAVYKSESWARSVLHTRLDSWSNVRYLAAANLRWLEVRLDAIVTSIIAVTGLIVVATSNRLTPSIIGLIMSQVLVLPASLRQGMRFSTSALQSMVAIDRLSFYATCLPSEGEASQSSRSVMAAETQRPTSGEIGIQNVSASHGQESSQSTSTALHNITLDIPAGTHVAVVGSTGAGKSTFVALLLRLLDPTIGTITLDGVSITDIPLRVLRSFLTAVPHDAVPLPSSTVRENVDPEQRYSDDDVSRVLSDFDQLAGLDDEQPLALDSSASNQLSPGTARAQLLALAAAILQKPQCCVLDETLGTLSVEADAQVTRRVRQVLRERTLVAVTHRMEVAMMFDRVLVLNDGQIEAYGTPHEVWSQGGFFRSACEKSGITPEVISRVRGEV